MLIDAFDLPPDELIQTDICIVGAGPAGLAIAMALKNTDLDLCLLESGGLTPDPDRQTLCASETLGQPCSIGPETRCRSLGGTSNLWSIRLGRGGWGVRLTPLDASDFDTRDWLPYSGWPFSKDELDPYYARAQDLCGSGPMAYDAQDWTTPQTPPLPLDAAGWCTTVYQFGQRDIFRHHHYLSLRDAANLRIYTHAQVLELELDQTGQQVLAVRGAAAVGHPFRVQARQVILAMGGVESTRLLLLSRQGDRLGVGNGQDWVGRCFMEHPRVELGTWIPSDRRLIHQARLYDLRQARSHFILGNLTLSPAIRQQEQLLNLSAMLFPQPKPYQRVALQSLYGLLYDLRRAGLGQRGSGRGAVLQQRLMAVLNGHPWPPGGWLRLYRVLLGLDYLLPAAYRRLVHHQPLSTTLSRGGWSVDRAAHRWFYGFQVLCMVEQEPDPANRITLGSEQDAFGQPLPQLHWRLSDRWVHSVLRSQTLLAEAMERSHLGHLQLARDEHNQPILESFGSHHPMGTTRMHPSPTQGVVDANSRVHGVENLYIASSSVFPTGGHANPTLTLIALALRLADHLKLQAQTSAVAL
jgi:choline dehydrogenase-like flavoprotein